MAKSTRKVDFFKVEFKCDGVLEFEQLLNSDKIKENEVEVGTKIVSIKILENIPQILVGIVETSRVDNLPPKKDRSTKTLAKLGLTEDEGLAYGNIFCFYKSKKVFLFENNKNGCSLNQFTELLYERCKVTKFGTINIEFLPLLARDEYKRLNAMTSKDKIAVRVANPANVVKANLHKEGSFNEIIKTGADLDASILEFNYAVDLRTSDSLNENRASKFIKQALEFLNGHFGNHLIKLEITGRGREGVASKTDTIDLIANRLRRKFIIDVPRENKDLLEKDRHRAIKEVFNGAKDEIDEILE